MKMLDAAAAGVWEARAKGQAAVASASPMQVQPVVTWVALTVPAQLQYDGTTVQAVQAALRKAFAGPDAREGDPVFPIKLNRSHLPILHGMIAAAGVGSTPYEILQIALDRFGEIEVRDR